MEPSFFALFVERRRGAGAVREKEREMAQPEAHLSWALKSIVRGSPVEWYFAHRGKSGSRWHAGEHS